MRWVGTSRSRPSVRSTVESMHAAVEHFLGHGVDGIAIIAPTTEVAQAIAAIDLPVPVVLISSASDLPAETPSARGRGRPAARCAPGHPAPARPGAHLGPARGRTAGLVRRAGPPRGLAGDQRARRPGAHRSRLGRLGRVRPGASAGARGSAVGDLRRERPAGARPAARVLGGGGPGACRRRARRLRRRGRCCALHAAADHRPAGLRGARARWRSPRSEAAFAGEETLHQRIPAELVVRASSVRSA